MDRDVSSVAVQTPRCVLCRRPVRGDAEGVLFGGFGRPMFVACHAHVPLIRAGASTLRRTVAAGVQTLVQRKLPNLWKFFTEVRKNRGQP